MSRLKVSWQLFLQSLRLIREHRKLLLFHVVLGALILLLIAFWLLPFTLAGTGHGLADPAHWQAVADRWFVTEAAEGDRALRPMAYLLPAAFYFSSIIAATFVNVALMHEVLRALNGGTVSVSRGLAFAATRARAVLAWSLLAGLVGMVIRALEHRLGWIGQWLLRLIGLAWSVAVIFVVPVIVREGTSANPVRHLRRSAAILRTTWGESLLGYVGINLGFVVALVTLLLLAFGIIAAVAFSQVGMLVLLAILALLVLGIFVLAILTSAANQVYRGALYVYATEGVVPGPYDEESMDRAWKLRAGRRAAPSEQASGA